MFGSSYGGSPASSSSNLFQKLTSQYAANPNPGLVQDSGMGDPSYAVASLPQTAQSTSKGPLTVNPDGSQTYKFDDTGMVPQTTAIGATPNAGAGQGGGGSIFGKMFGAGQDQANHAAIMALLNSGVLNQYLQGPIQGPFDPRKF